LAAAADIPLGTLRNLEQDRRIPRLDTADELARALSVSLDALTGDTFQEAATPEPAPTKKGKKRKAK
jgi:transcriptional regulator with XRE-family HTH domain